MRRKEARSNEDLPKRTDCGRRGCALRRPGMLGELGHSSPVRPYDHLIHVVGRLDHLINVVGRLDYLVHAGQRLWSDLRHYQQRGDDVLDPRPSTAKAARTEGLPAAGEGWRRRRGAYGVRIGGVLC